MSAAPDDPSHADGSDPIEAAAAAWLARRDRGLTPDEVVEFARWRQADPRHEAAVADLNAMWNALDDLSALRGKTAETPAASHVPPAGNVAGARPTQRRNIFPAWAWAMAACLALAAGMLAWQQRAPSAATDTHYETAVGDQRTITLPDGSTLQLNTDSAAEVRYVARERRVALVRGEAFFRVTKDPQRPFVVASGGVEAHALGTAFVVRQHVGKTELVVAEGRVKFGGAQTGALRVEVATGQTAMVDPLSSAAPGVEILDAAALARRLAWKNGDLVCRPGMSLEEAAAEFNRYHRTQLELPDAATRAVAIGGSFSIAKLDAFVRSLETSFDVVVVERSPERIVLRLKR